MKLLPFLLCSLCVAPVASAKTVGVASPDGMVAARLSDAAGTVTLAVDRGDVAILRESAISLDLLGVKKASAIKKTRKSSVSGQRIDAPFYRQKSFELGYNAVTAVLDNGVAIELRAYDSGVAYRYVTDFKTEEVVVLSETCRLAFPADLEAWLPYSTNDANPKAMAFQNIYDRTALSHAADKLAFLPATVSYGSGLKLTIAESDLESYPGMFVKADTTALALCAEFAPYPAAFEYYPWRMQQYVSTPSDCIARTAGSRTYPWRVLAITTDDRQMPVNNLVYALASPSRIADTSWIRPGKVAWDWWNDWGLTGVDFTTGINMPTYRKYIDFAAEHGIEYVVLDEGWYESKSGDMLAPIADIDVRGLVDYGRSRGVGIVLWCVYNVLDSRLDQICSHYADMGVKGFKVDFLDRDDQTAVEMAYRIADACARHRLMLDYHGIYKPTGLNRTYPNVLNFESVFGMEEARWTDKQHDMPLYDVTFPYIRLLAGYVDFTPGAMRNGSQLDWQANYYNPMSQGTRCHQAAAYVVYDSPFTMLCDSPSAYEAEPEYTRFIVDIPCDVDSTCILQGCMGEYIVTARRKGADWWVGGLTNWDARDIDLDLGFLDDGEYTATILADGMNAHHRAEDHSFSTRQVSSSSVIGLHMAPGGGFVVRLSRR